MQYRIYEIRREKFDVLLNNLGFTSRMKKALVMRYESNCCHTRPQVSFTYCISEQGLMKAEKKILNAHKEFSDVYGD